MKFARSNNNIINCFILPEYQTPMRIPRLCIHPSAPSLFSIYLGTVVAIGVRDAQSHLDVMCQEVARRD